jgi:hypothetical protein
MFLCQICRKEAFQPEDASTPFFFDPFLCPFVAAELALVHVLELFNVDRQDLQVMLPRNTCRRALALPAQIAVEAVYAFF